MMIVCRLERVIGIEFLLQIMTQIYIENFRSALVYGELPLYYLLIIIGFHLQMSDEMINMFY